MSLLLELCGCAKVATLGHEPKKGPASSVHAGDVDSAPIGLETKHAKKVGYFSNHGWEQKASMFGVGKKEVKPKINQDRLVVTPNLANNPDAIMFACYDGNGPNGEKVAEMAAHEVIAGFASESPAVFSGDLDKKVKDLLVSANKQIVKQGFSRRSGSTATIIIVHGAKVMCANVGDSKACRIVEDVKGNWIADCIISEHLPEKEEEKKRIEAAGGYVLINKEEYGAPRVFDNPDPIGQMVQMMGIGSGMGGAGDATQMMNSMNINEPWPGLAMSRVLGHQGVEKIGITPEPDVLNYNLTVADKAIILASDGVWDFIEEEEAAQIVKRFAPDAEAACKSLVETATQRWIEDDPTYRDDITALVAYMPLGEGELGSADSVVFTSNSASAIADRKAEEDAIAAGKPATGEADITVQVDGGKKSAPVPAAAAADADDDAARRRRIKASKEQMKRSVISRYG